MRALMGDFESALPEFDFVYAQTPESGGVWIVDPPGKDEPTTDPHWADNSFNYLDNLIASQGPFYALCGYSQGSAIIPVYLAHRGGGSGVTSTQGPASSTTNGGNQRALEQLIENTFPRILSIRKKVIFERTLQCPPIAPQNRPTPPQQKVAMEITAPAIRSGIALPLTTVGAVPVAMMDTVTSTAKIDQPGAILTASFFSTDMFHRRISD